MHCVLDTLTDSSPVAEFYHVVRHSEVLQANRTTAYRSYSQTNIRYTHMRFLEF